MVGWLVGCLDNPPRPCASGRVDPQLLNPLSPVPGEGFTLPLPLPTAPSRSAVRDLKLGSPPFFRFFGFKKIMKKTYLSKVNNFLTWKGFLDASMLNSSHFDVQKWSPGGYFLCIFLKLFFVCILEPFFQKIMKF